jgi:hypothetical protein
MIHNDHELAVMQDGEARGVARLEFRLSPGN